MNREYRVYDTEQKRYITDERMWFITTDGTLYYLKTENAGFIKADNCVVEHAVGLPDKNKNQIFEGDIVKSNIFASPRIFVVRYCIAECKFQLKNRNAEYGISNVGIPAYEVVGNIHDNSELLKTA